MIAIPTLFQNQDLLQNALTHRSYCNEHPGTPSNERLEFLGDSVLSLIISDRLYHLYPTQPEGELTSRRSILVQTTTLAQKSQLLGLDNLILLSHGEQELGGRTNTGLLADTFEAVLGALFLDSGINKCQEFLLEVFPDDEILSYIHIKDPKSSLQEHAQAKNMGTPIYHLVSSVGPDHAKLFTVEVLIGDVSYATGTGASKQKAETEAAKLALSKLFPS